jgi:hypothetical protein
MLMNKRKQDQIAHTAHKLVERLKANAKPPRKADHNWITFAAAVGDIAEALSLRSEVAEAILFGLVATGDIRAQDHDDEIIDLNECTIAELSGKPVYVSENELKDWLRKYSAAPTKDRDRVITERLQIGLRPPRNIPWKRFYDDIRSACNGWQGKGDKRKPAWGFSDKQIQRAVKALGQR